MATNQVLISTGADIIFASTNYSPATNTILGSNTLDALAVDGLTTGQARESLKVDLGASHAPSFSVDLSMEPATDPAAGGTIDLYWSESHSATAAVGNMGLVTGADADWAGASGITLAESLLMMKYIGSFSVAVQNDADGSAQVGHVGIFSPIQRYGVLVYLNNTSITLHDDVESAVRFTPVIPDIQAAA